MARQIEGGSIELAGLLVFFIGLALTALLVGQ
jgi:hypothetical protein